MRRLQSQKTALRVVMVVRNRVAKKHENGDARPWEEVHVVDHRQFTIHPAKGEKEVRNRVAREAALAEAYVRAMVESFNVSLRPHESPREIVKIKEITRCLPLEHDFRKQNLMTEKGNGGFGFDRYRCERCGVTAKRYGLSPSMTRDRKFKDSVYQYCASSMKKLGVVG